MTNYRKRLPDETGRITQQAVEAFKAGDTLALHRTLRLKPWEASPLDATTDTPPGCGDLYVKSWARARELRAQLEAA